MASYHEVQRRGATVFCDLGVLMPYLSLPWETGTCMSLWTRRSVEARLTRSCISRYTTVGEAEIS